MGMWSVIWQTIENGKSTSTSEPVSALVDQTVGKSDQIISNSPLETKLLATVVGAITASINRTIAILLNNRAVVSRLYSSQHLDSWVVCKWVCS
jgi:hypothetical protein